MVHAANSVPIMSDVRRGHFLLYQDFRKYVTRYDVPGVRCEFRTVLVEVKQPSRHRHLIQGPVEK